MNNQKVIIEITDTEIRLLVGYVDNNKTHISYIAQRPIKGLISRGRIVDPGTLSQIISSLREVKDPKVKNKYVIDEVTVILPPLGLEILEDTEMTRVVSNYSVIEQIDIENAVALVTKERIKPGFEIIDIVPDYFILEDGRRFTKPPLGEKSNTITLKAKIHTMPIDMVNDFKKVIESAHMSVGRFTLNSYAACELGKYLDNIPQNYILVDMGSEVCSVTLVGNDAPFSTVPFEAGGSFIINKLVENYKIDPETALDLLTNCGYSDRKLSFTPSLAKCEVQGEFRDFTQDDLNNVIKEYFSEEFFPRYDAAFATLCETYNDNVKHFPLVFMGGFSMMIGFEKIAKERFSTGDSILFMSPNTIGARTPQYAASVGGLYVSYANKGSLTEQRKKLEK